MAPRLSCASHVPVGGRYAYGRNGGAGSGGGRLGGRHRVVIPRNPAYRRRGLLKMYLKACSGITSAVSSVSIASAATAGSITFKGSRSTTATNVTSYHP